MRLGDRFAIDLFREAEFHLPGESRVWFLKNIPVCPDCGCLPLLSQRAEKGILHYSVRCTTEGCRKSYNTEWLPSSVYALTRWNLAAKLATL